MTMHVSRFAMRDYSKAETHPMSPPPPTLALMIGLALASPAAARSIPVGDTVALAAAIAHAAPGDDIVLADGLYPIAHKLMASASGTAMAPITVRAAHRFAARIRASGLIAFEVTGSHWVFADLDIRGVCAEDTTCEHAFHVVGGAGFFTLTGSRLVDFNAHLKVNADEAHAMPESGLVEGNEFYDSHPRHTGNPVAPINIDNAIAWVVRGNSIHDFQKDGPGEDSYGAFVKGGSQRPLIERNRVNCAASAPIVGRMVGLSFGAHGMMPALCPPHWNAAMPCDPEVQGGIIRNNIVRNCNGEGIYINRGAQSAILFNTVLETAGIDFRFAGSGGVARGNLLDTGIRAQDGGNFTDGGNAVLPPRAGTIAAGGKPAASPVSLPGPDPMVPDDLCGRARGHVLTMGAVQAAPGDCPTPAASSRYPDAMPPR
jgi:hypothetical protein